MAFHNTAESSHTEFYKSIRGVDKPVTDTYTKLGPWTAVEGGEVLGILFNIMSRAMIEEFGSEELKRNINPESGLGQLGIKSVDSLSPVHKESWKSVMGLQSPYEARRMTGTEIAIYKNFPDLAASIGLTPESVEDGRETKDGSWKVKVKGNLLYFFWKTLWSHTLAAPVADRAYFENPHSKELNELHKAAFFFLQSDIGFKQYPVSGDYSVRPEAKDAKEAYGAVQGFMRGPETDVERQAEFRAKKMIRSLEEQGEEALRQQQLVGVPTPQEQQKGYQEIIKDRNKDKKR